MKICQSFDTIKSKLTEKYLCAGTKEVFTI